MDYSKVFLKQMYLSKVWKHFSDHGFSLFSRLYIGDERMTEHT